jgi:pimeloyl-ACP methyl ester carboxylesterase
VALSQPPAHPNKRRRLFRLGGFLVFVALLTAFLAPTLSGALYMWHTIHPGCGDGGRTPGSLNLPYTSFVLPADWGGSRGFYIPGWRSATILIPPTFGSGRDGPLAQIGILASHGYNVMTWESRSCTAKGLISLGYREVDDVGVALSYLKHNPDHLPISATSLDHIGIYGFSSGGATATMATARYPELAALISEGGYHNTDEIYGLNTPHGIWQTLSFLGAGIAYRIGTGEDPVNLNPIGAVPHIPPRPILFIYGSRETGGTVQLAAARAALPNTSAELWVVPNAGHGGYIGAVGIDVYAGYMRPFFDCALLNEHCDQYRALWQPF